MIDFEALWKLVTESCPGNVNSPVHGLSHWRQVEHNAIRLAPHTGANFDVVRLFAIFHDSCRVNDDADEGHGTRGATFAKKLRGSAYDLDDASLALLIEACERHADGDVSDDPTIGTCWDADRLDLPRVGIIPRAEYMSTALVKEKISSMLPAFPSRVLIRSGEDDGEKEKEVQMIRKKLGTPIPRFLECKDTKDYEKLYGLPALQEFAKEFYDLFYESSGALSNYFGSTSVLEVFRRLAPFRNMLQASENDSYVERLPSLVTIYRGGAGPSDQLALGISWSTSDATAQSYARSAEGGIVITGSINRSDILAAYLEESEIIVDPKSVTGIRVHI